ncbi:MAG: hypothetical protein KIS78_35735 [Labilithrix sp.]|nr:hypothetical protein [Labilithrix sp.]MCW5837799.1 hypothetical protein [Labilithrix sp.]
MRERGRRSLGLALAAMVLAASFVGCPLLKKKGAEIEAGVEDEDPSAALADAETVTATGLGAKNEANVLRYANETPLPNEPAVIGDGGAKARNFPGNGPEVATLPKGTAVVKVAQYFNTGVLILFDDPSGDGSKLVGWVTPKVFDATAPEPTVKPIVPVPVVKVDAGSNAAVKDAGAPIKDAGSSVAVKDAGAAPAVVDAGGAKSSTIPQPPKSAVAVAPTADGKCPDGWAISEGMCRRKCAADAECPRNTKCASKQGVKVCTSDH